MGDTPRKEAAAALGIEPGYTGGGFDTGGLLSPVMSACLAVAEKRARHVLVYRTVQMMGGSIVPAEGVPPAPPPSERPGESAGAMRNGLGGLGPLLADHAD